MSFGEKDHSSYDDFWQKRHSSTFKGYQTCSNDSRWLVLMQDLYGPLNTYQAIEKTRQNYNTIVMGPWSHGDWARNGAKAVIGNINFGDSISRFYQRISEIISFVILKNNGKGENFLKLMFLILGSKSGKP
jgi:predicted acyl esterase